MQWDLNRRSSRAPHGIPATQWEDWPSLEDAPESWRYLLHARDLSGLWYAKNFVSRPYRLQVFLDRSLWILMACYAGWMAYSGIGLLVSAPIAIPAPVGRWIAYCILGGVALIVVVTALLWGGERVRQDADERADSINKLATLAFRALGGDWTKLGKYMQESCAPQGFRVRAGIEWPGFPWKSLASLSTMMGSAWKLASAQHAMAATLPLALSVISVFFLWHYTKTLRTRIQALHPERYSPCRYMPLRMLLGELARHRDGTRH
ncbi:hypothetical protein JKG47_01750 [Acidithiobacillus sp. MC6.1]|nr:hypothetical protein [Acidithiobacillus sp. MC6.1]